MGLKRKISKSVRWLHRRVQLPELDTISKISARSPEFVSVRGRVCSAGTDSLAVFGKDYTCEGGLSLQQNPDEFTSLCLRLKESGPIGNYLEVGSASGGACLFLWKELGMARVVCLDDGRHPRAKEQDVNLAGIPNLKRHIGDSHAPEAGKFLEQSISGKLDVAFIDGDHTYDGVWQDIKLAMRFSRPGTLFILHDTVACRDVENAWLECVKEKLLAPLAEYIGEERPLGIAIGAVQ